MTYIIKPVTEDDRKWVVQKAAREMLFNEVKRPELYNPAQLSFLLSKVINDGTGLICWKDGVRVGLVCAMKTPHFLNPSHVTLTELIWYIDPEHRRTRATILLLRGFKELAEVHADEGIFTLLVETPISNESMEKIGFKPLERNFSYRI